jgi:excisionase family DNA binding protein
LLAGLPLFIQFYSVDTTIFIRYLYFAITSMEVISLVLPAEWPAVGMTLEEAADSLRVDSKTLRRLIKEEGFPARKVGVGWRIDPDAVKRWLAERPTTAEADEEE